jgi:hypothetical protein
VSLLLWALGLLAFRELLLAAMRRSYAHHRLPVPYNQRWENDDRYDILWFAGVRKNKGDAGSGGGAWAQGGAFRSERERVREWRRRHHVPEGRPKPPSRYSHNIYSNTRSGGRTANKERHRRFVQERREERERVARWREECRAGREPVRRGAGGGFTVPEGEGKDLVGRAE